MAPPDFGRSVNPMYLNQEGQLMPTTLLLGTGTPGFSDLPTVLLISVPFKLLPLLMAGIFALIVFATSTSKCLGKSDLINILPFFAPSISALVLVSTWFFRTLLGCSLYIFHFFHGSFLLPYLSSYLNKIYNFV